MIIQILCVGDNQEDWINHPTYDNALVNEDCGIDIPMPIDISVPGQKRAFSVPLGIKTMTDKGYMLVPRSSISKTPLRMANSIGIIDKNYRGELIVKLDNLSLNDFVLEKGKCYFQIIAFDGVLPKMKIVTEINETRRGEGGFGSTTN